MKNGDKNLDEGNIADVSKKMALLRATIEIFFDIDGTLAQFLFGTPFPMLFKMGYFEDLPPQENLIEAARILWERGWKIKILTAYLIESKYALAEKKSWLKRYLPWLPAENWIFTPCGTSKGDFLQHPGDVLVDDRTVHGREWEGAGGNFVKVSVNAKDAQKEVGRFQNIVHPDMTGEEIADVIESVLIREAAI